MALVFRIVTVKVMAVLTLEMDQKVLEMLCIDASTEDIQEYILTPCLWGELFWCLAWFHINI